MPEVSDHYIGAETLLPRGHEMGIGQIVARSHDISGNVMWRAQTNSILDIRMYQVKFARGKVSELTANIIDQSI